MSQLNRRPIQYFLNSLLKYNNKTKSPRKHKEFLLFSNLHVHIHDEIGIVTTTVVTNPSRHVYIHLFSSTLRTSTPTLVDFCCTHTVNVAYEVLF